MTGDGRNFDILGVVLSVSCCVASIQAGIVLVAIKLTIVGPEITDLLNIPTCTGCVFVFPCGLAGRALKQSFPQWNGQVRQSSQRKTSKIRCKVGPGQQCQQSTISSLSLKMDRERTIPLSFVATSSRGCLKHVWQLRIQCA